jgi:hypothetical protein
MSVIENLSIGGCIGAAIGISAFFLHDGNKLRKEGQQKEGKIVMAMGTVIGVVGITNLFFALRK